MLLSPRNTALLEGRPLLRWTRIATASDYVIELLGQRGAFVARLRAADVDCGHDAEGWGETDVCAAAYPAALPELAPGKSYFLSIGARESIASPLDKPTFGELVRRLPTEQAAAVAAAAEKVQALPLVAAAHWLILAGLFADYELLTDAVVAYRHVLDLEPTAEVRVSLGDAYLRTGLGFLAEHSYRAAGEASSEPAVAAAVAFGLGHSHVLAGRYAEAIEHFRHAGELYQRLGFEEEATVASQQAAKMERRLPK